MTNKTITPRVLPVGMPLLRAQLKLDDPEQVNEEDVLIQAYADQACDFAQHYTGRAIGVQELELALDGFPSGAIQLPFAPARSVVTVKYLDSTGELRTYAPSGYVLDDYGDTHSVAPAFATAWPSIQATPNSVKVRYIAGYGPDNLPASVRGALLLLVGLYYQQRGAASQVKATEIPIGVHSLLDTIKSWGV